MKKPRGLSFKFSRQREAIFYELYQRNLKLLSPAISRLARMRRWQIEQWVLDPVAVQREVLQDLVTSAQYTEIGRKYNFSKLFSIKEFKKAVPIHEYDDLKPYIQRIMQGEENLLWNTPINWFAKSSGTTSDKSKFIPISEESLQDNHFLGRERCTDHVLSFSSGIGSAHRQRDWSSAAVIPLIR